MNGATTSTPTFPPQECARLAVDDPPREAGDDDAARSADAAQIRREHPRWVVIWVARKGEFQARPLFRAPRGTVAVGVTPDELTAQMDAIWRAAPRRARPSRS
jgi:hypothetical protein